MKMLDDSKNTSKKTSRENSRESKRKPSPILKLRIAKSNIPNAISPLDMIRTPKVEADNFLKPLVLMDKAIENNKIRSPKYIKPQPLSLSMQL